MKKTTLTTAISGLLVASALVLTPVQAAPENQPEIVSEQEMLARYETGLSLRKGAFSSGLVPNSTVYPHWIEDSESFWYIRGTGGGYEYRLVKPGSKSNKTAFDHKKLATLLADATGETVDPASLPFLLRSVEITLKPFRVSFKARDRQWTYDGRMLTEGENIPSAADWRNSPGGPPGWRVSPDGKYAVLTRDHNLWLRNLETGGERPLTTDGEEFNVYGGAMTAWGSAPREGNQVLWSPDSKRVFTIQRDTRLVKELPIVHHVPKDGSIRPQLEMIKVAYPGDEHIERVRLLSIDVVTGKQQPAAYRKIPSIRNWGFFKAGLGWWHRDGRLAYFIDMERYHQSVKVVEFDTYTGDTRVLFEETSKTNINLMLNSDMRPAFIPLPETDELLWYSERTGWAHYYLYDLKTGKLKNVVTSGDWVVREAMRFDATRRELFLQTAGRVAGRDPYYRDIVRVNVDTGQMVTVVSGDYDIFASAPNDFQLYYLIDFSERTNGLSPSMQYIVLTRSRVDTVPESVVINRNGKEVMKLETADISALPEGWQWPKPFKTTAADGRTDIYGVLFRPTHFDPNKSYPVISHMFNQPELPWASKGAFENNAWFNWGYFDAAALAELGFIVVQLDGRGTAFRSKAFKDESYGWMESSSNMADHVAGIKELGKRYPWMDLDRVGVTTHITGGSGGIQGMLQYPDFYKVGVVGNPHDSRMIGATPWGDFYEGPDGPRPGSQFPEEYAANLKGKLLLRIGMLDGCCSPPASAFRIVAALLAADKDFDLMVYPQSGHFLSTSYGSISPNYGIRRTWDFFVRHLMGATPPQGFGDNK